MPMLNRLLFVVSILALCGAGGCTTGHGINTDAMRGKPLAEVTVANQLNQYHSWPVMNLPAGAEQGTIYFLNEGDLWLWYSGQPPVVRKAEFWPSDKSAQQRFDEANAAWDQWAKSHTFRSGGKVTVPSAVITPSPRWVPAPKTKKPVLAEPVSSGSVAGAGFEPATSGL